MKFKSINFSCKNCGAYLKFSPISNSLFCEFCDTKESIENSLEEIEEYSFKDALEVLSRVDRREIEKETRCSKCSASFTISSYSISSTCPYCGTPIITDFTKKIEAKSLLPFQISEKKAQKLFKKWIGSLWFAPSKLKKFISGEYNLKGYYLPHWTYDSETSSQYIGERGDIYYVNVERRVVVDGREERQIVRESRVRWTHVSGEVRVSFDDITVGASKTISHTILDNLEPWYTDVLVPFNQKYLAGFDSEEYLIGLDDGFDFAKVKMKRVIMGKIKNKIGGDQQKINHIATQYQHTTYKNVLFPIWTAKFKWNNRTYNYAINGQTGKVTGERPYSLLKIMLLVITVAIIIGGVIYLDFNPNILNYF